MDFRYLKAFLNVVETKSFSSTAKRLKIAQSAVSRQIKLFEESVGQQLLVRSRTGLVVTPAGAELYKRAQEFVTWQSVEFQNSIGEIRIGCLQGILDHWLLARLEKMSAGDLPNISIRVMTDEGIHEALLQGQIDIGLTAKKIENENISSLKLFEEKFCLISRDEIDRQRLHEYRWISGSRASYLNRASKKTSARFIKVESNDMIQKLVARGFGIAILPEHVLNPSLKLKTYKSTHVQTGTIFLATPNYARTPIYLKDFLGVLRL